MIAEIAILLSPFRIENLVSANYVNWNISFLVLNWFETKTILKHLINNKMILLKFMKFFDCTKYVKVLFYWNYADLVILLQLSSVFIQIHYLCTNSYTVLIFQIYFGQPLKPYCSEIEYFWNINFYRFVMCNFIFINIWIFLAMLQRKTFHKFNTKCSTIGN